MLLTQHLYPLTQTFREFTLCRIPVPELTIRYKPPKTYYLRESLTRACSVQSSHTCPLISDTLERRQQKLGARAKKNCGILGRLSEVRRMADICDDVRCVLPLSVVNGIHGFCGHTMFGLSGSVGGVPLYGLMWFAMPEMLNVRLALGSWTGSDLCPWFMS